MNSHQNVILKHSSSPETLYLLKKYFSPVVFLNPCEFLAVHFLIKLVHEKGKTGQTPCKSLYQHRLLWFAPTPSHAVVTCIPFLKSVGAASGTDCSDPRGWWGTGTRQMLQVWLFYNLLVKLHRTIWYLQLWPQLLSKGPLSEKLPSNPEVATLPRTAHAGFEVGEASRPQCLSQPRGSQGSAAEIALEAELWDPLHPSGLPALQRWPLQERKSLNKRHTLKYPSEERHSAAQEASMYWSKN